MIHELRKIRTNRYAIILLLVIVAANGLLFYNHCMDDSNGYTLQQIQQNYDRPKEDLVAAHDGLWDRIVFSESHRDETLITGDIYKEYALYGNIIQRMEAVHEYSQKIQTLMNEIRLKKLLFASGDPFYTEVLSKTEELYHNLEGLSPTACFSGATEPISTWQFSDVFVLIFGLMAALLLISQEKSNGVIYLCRSTKHGHTGLYLQKAGAMSALLFIGFILIYGTNFIIAGALFGFGPLERAIQSVHGFDSCPFVLSVGDYLILFLLMRWLWCWATSMLFFFVSNCCKGIAHIMLSCVAVVTLSVWMSSSSVLWLRALSIVSYFQPTSLLNEYSFLNWFGNALPLLPFALCFLCGILLLSLLFGGIFFCRQSPYQSKSISLFRLPRLRSTKLFVQEGWKLLFLHGALVAVILFGAVQAVRYQDFYVRNDAWEQFYRTYSQKLSGPRTEEKDLYLKTESERYAQLHDRLIQTHDPELRDQIAQQLFPEDAFLFASSQYFSLTGKQMYVYTTGYERLFGGEGRADNLANSTWLIVVLITVLSGVFAVENESGMNTLISTAGKRKATAKYKYIHSFILTTIVSAIAYLPQYISVYRGYGLPERSAPANSLTMFSGLPEVVSLNLLLIFSVFAQLAFSLMVCFVVSSLSKRFKNTITTVIVASTTMLLPMLLIVAI